jgi:hypothetical protein
MAWANLFGHRCAKHFTNDARWNSNTLAMRKLSSTTIVEWPSEK